MTSRTIALLAVATFGVGAAAAQTGAKPEAKPEAKPPAMSPEQQKMMEAWQKFATPGPEHQKLKAMAGTWDVKATFWMDPKAPPQESTGKAEMKMVLGDRYLLQEFTGDMMGQPFTGWGIQGYDNAKKKWLSFWIDSAGSGFYAGEGTADKTGNVITYATSTTDPVTGKAKKGRDVWTLESAGKFKLEMYGQGPKGGKEVKMMEIVYTKK